MVVKTEKKTLGDVLLWEEDNFYSRDSGTIAMGGAYDVGMVLGRVTASGKYVPYDPTAATGEETVAAVLAQNVDASAADVTDVLLIARHSRVKRHGLSYGATVDTAAERDAAVAGLKALGILSDV